MANIRVTCPECKSELELDAEFEGQEVECGNCLKVFKATRPGSGGPSSSGAGKIPGASPRSGAGSGGGSGRGRPADRPAPKKRRGDESDDDYGRGRRRREEDEDDERDRRRREEEDEDDYAPPPPRRAGDGGDGVATASLVLGAFSIVMVCCCWPVAIPLGLAASITGGLGLKSQNNQGTAVAGLVMGIIAMCMSGVAFFLGFGNAVNRFN